MLYISAFFLVVFPTVSNLWDKIFYRSVTRTYMVKLQRLSGNLTEKYFNRAVFSPQRFWAKEKS